MGSLFGGVFFWSVLDIEEDLERGSGRRELMMGDQSDERSEGVDCVEGEFSDSVELFVSSGRAWSCSIVEVECISVPAEAWLSCFPFAGAAAGDGVCAGFMSVPTLILA